MERDLAVVVPTRDRPRALARCLEALSTQVDGRIAQIVVVDDGSEDGEAVRRLVEAVDVAELVRLGGAGPAAARNAGLACVRTPSVLFTDDDCVPASSWADSLGKQLRGGAAAVAGPTVAAASAGAFAKASQSVVNALSQTPGSGGRRGYGFVPSSNLGVATSVAREIGFAEGYAGAGGEDRDFCARLARAGHTIAFVQDAVVVHDAELTLPRFVAQHVRYGRGAYRFRALAPTAHRFQPAAFYLRLVGSAFRSGLSAGVLVLLAQGATAVGFALEALGASAAPARSRSIESVTTISLPPASRTRLSGGPGAISDRDARARAVDHRRRARE